MSRFRKLKIYQKYQPREWGSYAIVPEIRLQGKWLKELGFEIGKEITITQQKNKLTITLIDETNENN